MKQATKVGLSGGLVVSVAMLAVTYLPMGETIKGMSRMIMLLLIIATAFISIRRTRDFEMEGVISLGQAIKAGMKSGVLLSLILGVTIFIMQNYIDDVRLVLNEVHPITKVKIADTPTLLQRGASIGALIQQVVFFTIMNMLLSFFASAAAAMMLKRASATIGR